MKYNIDLDYFVSIIQALFYIFIFIYYIYLIFIISNIFIIVIIIIILLLIFLLPLFSMRNGCLIKLIDQPKSFTIYMNL